MHRFRKQNKGFTLIELLLSMSFVAVLIIFILTATLQVTRIYNKGITLKQVNQAGASVGNDLQASLKGADAKIDTTQVANGRLCLGLYSYVWNLKNTTTNQYSGSDSGTLIAMAKVDDPNKAMCDHNPAVPKDKSIELVRGINTTGVQLQLRNFAINEVANSGGVNYIYQVDYTIGTDDQSLIAATPTGSGACAGGPGDEYCALNSFTLNVFARKGGSGQVN